MTPTHFPSKGPLEGSVLSRQQINYTVPKNRALISKLRNLRGTLSSAGDWKIHIGIGYNRQKKLSFQVKEKSLISGITDLRHLNLIKKNVFL